MTGIDVVAFTDLDAVAADAAGALDRAAQPSLFDRLDWYRRTLAHCPPPGRPLVLRARDAAATAWLFLMLDRRRATALASWYTLRFAAPVLPHGQARGVEPVATGLLPPQEHIEAIARALRRHAGALALAPLDRATGDLLAGGFARAGWTTVLAPATVNHWAAVTDWPSYWAARPSRLRETVRRRGRGDPFRLLLHDRFDAAAWADYEAVYARSWKPAEGSPAFLRALAEREGAAGTLRLGVAYDGARPVAAQVWLVEGGVAIIHKLAHDEADRARSPGTLLSHAMFAHAIGIDRVGLIDFGTGDDAYKADWTDRRRILWRLDAWNLRTARGLAGWVRHRLARLRRLNRVANPAI